MTQWSEQDPGAGNIGSLYSSASRLQSLQTALDTARTATTQAGADVAGRAWVGTSGDSWRTSVSSIATELETHRAGVEAAQAALNAYAARVEDIRARARFWRTSVAEAEALLHQLPNEWQLALDPLMSPQDKIHTEQRRLAAGAKRDRAIAELVALAAERRSADSAAASALEKAAPADWKRQRAALAAIGITGIADLNDAKLDAKMGDILERLATGSTLTNDELNAVRAYLELYGNDSARMSRLFLQLGGENTVKAIDALGMAYMQAVNGDPESTSRTYYPEYTDLAKDIRAALGAASANWLPSTGRDFAEQMFAGGSDGAGAISYLFADSAHHPLGQNLTIAAADQLDQHVRVDGESWKRGAATFLWNEDHPANEEQQIVDPAGSIFDTLGTYPDAAFDFLDPSGSVDTGRVDYWFGEHDWTSDKWEGPSSLWLGAEQSDGGRLDPNATSEQLKDHAEVASRIIYALDRGDGDTVNGVEFISDHLSDKAAGAIATAVSIELPSIMDYVYSHAADDGGAPGTADPSTLFGWVGDGSGQGTMWAPNVDSGQLAHLLGEVGAHDTGAAVLATERDQLQAQYLTIASNNPDALPEALDRSAAVQAMIDGSTHGATLGAAERADAATQRLIDGFKDIVGLVPIPGLGEVATHLGVPLSAVTEQLLNVAGDHAQDFGLHAVADFAKTYPHVVDDENLKLEIQKHSAELMIAGLAAAALGLPPHVPVGADASPDAYNADAQKYYNSIREQVRTQYGVDLDVTYTQYENGSTAWAALNNKPELAGYESH